MNILNITELTDDPNERLSDNVNDAIDEYEGETGKSLTVQHRDACHSFMDSIIEDFEENGKVSDASDFVDNLLVNFDYYTMVKEIMEEEE